MTTHGVISADSHVFEPPDLWVRYIENRYKDRAPRVIQQDGEDRMFIEGLDSGHVGFQGSAGRKSEDLSITGHHDDARRGGWDPTARFEDMDEDGIDTEVLYTTLGFRLYRLKDLGYQLACFRAYNDWMADLISADSQRLVGIGLIPLADVEEGVKELRRVVKLGLKGVGIAAVARADQPYSDPRYEPFWAEAENLEIPLSLHILTEDTDDKRSLLPGNFIVQYGTSPVKVQTTIATLITSGVLERFPRLKFVSVENDIGWAATFVERMDHAYSRHRFWSGAAANMTIAPGEYFRRQIYLTFMRDRAGIELRHHIGVDNIMWSSDYPHPDSTWPNSRQAIEEQMHDVPSDERHKIVCGNVTSLYNLATSQNLHPNLGSK